MVVCLHLRFLSVSYFTGHCISKSKQIYDVRKKKQTNKNKNTTFLHQMDHTDPGCWTQYTISGTSAVTPDPEEVDKENVER